jgi:hypothetical protein
MPPSFSLLPSHQHLQSSSDSSNNASTPLLLAWHTRVLDNIWSVQASNQTIIAKYADGAGRIDTPFGKTVPLMGAGPALTYSKNVVYLTFGAGS